MQSDLSENKVPPLIARINKSLNDLNPDLYSAPGGIDLNNSNLNMQIKRDGQGFALPLAQQDLAQLNAIQGFEPNIMSIRPWYNLLFK